MRIKKLKYSIFISLIVLTVSLNGQVYLGSGITRSFAHKFNGDDVSFSGINIDGQPMINTWLEDRSYNFFTLFAGYKIKDGSYYHDIRVTATNKGAKSLLNKTDFELDPIIIDLNAFKTGDLTQSTLFEIGVNNRVVGLRYAFGKRWTNWLSTGIFTQTDFVYKKIFGVHWYKDRVSDFYTLNDKRNFKINGFNKESELANKVSNINFELGINALVHLGKYFAINLEVAQSIIPSVHKGPNPEFSEYVYFEKNEYFTSMQIGLLTYFSK